MDKKGEIYCKEFTQAVMEAGKSKICRVGQQAEDPGSTNVAVHMSESCLLAEFPFAGGR